jgi:hypothetical protein
MKATSTLVRPALHHTAHITSKMNAAHSHKSGKYSSLAVEEMISANPHRLPEIARDPFKVLRDAEAMRIKALNPFLVSIQEEYASDQTPTKSPQSQSARSRSQDKSHAEASPQSARSAGSLQSPNRSSSSTDKPPAEVEPNELTLTYLKTLQKAEDFARRGILRTEFKTFSSIHRLWLAFMKIVERYIFDVIDIVDREKDSRKGDQMEESEARKRLAAQKEHHYRIAKRKEDIRPDCPLITAGKRVHLDPKHVDGMAVELRWRGGIYAALYAMAFDEDNQLIGIASTTEVLRGAQSSVAVNFIPSLPGAPSLSIGGSTYCLFVILGNLSVRTKRLCFAVFNTAYPGASLGEMHRSWLTLREVTQTSNGNSVKDIYSCGLENGGPNTCVVLASLMRHHTRESAWQFACHNEPYIWTPTPAKLAASLTLAAKDPFEALEQQLTSAYERLASYWIMNFWEDVQRRTLVALQQDSAHDLWGAMSAEMTSLIQARERRRANRNRGSVAVVLGDKLV